MQANSRMAMLATRPVVLTALAGNGALAVAKLVAAAWTGSAALLANGVLSIAAAASQAMIAFGARRIDPREACFWSFVVAILLFSLGAGVAISEGVGRLLRPQPLIDPLMAALVLGAGVLFQAGVIRSALRGLERADGHVPRQEPSKDPGLVTVLLEGVAGVAGSLLALAGIAATHLAGWQEGDALAAIGVGLVLGAVAAKMALETKALLAGRPSTVLDRDPYSDTSVGGNKALAPTAAPSSAAGTASDAAQICPEADSSISPSTPIAPSRDRVEPPKRSYPPPKPGKGKKKRR